MNSKSIKGWWPKRPAPGNMGDIITPAIIKSLFDINVGWVNKNESTEKEILFGTGSIIGETTDSSIVWGSGLISEYSVNKANDKAEYLAVRGPITRELLMAKGIRVPEVYGDPGLLAHKLVNTREKNTKYEYGIVPHYIDFNEVSQMFKNQKNVKVINVLNSNPLVPIREILKCEKSVASSLHGIIFSHSVGVPSAWVKFSDKLAGDNTKFFDYFNSIKAEASYTYFNESRNAIDKLGKLRYIPPKQIDLNPLIKAFIDRFGGNHARI